MFTHLRVHSDRSLLRSVASPAVLAATAARMGFSAMALTDTHYLSGAMVFAEAMRSAGCRPLVGLELGLHVPALGSCPLVLLAMDEEGYRNLLRLSTLSAFAVAEGRGGLEFDQVATHHRGLVALSGGPDGDAGQWVRRENPALARAAMERCRDVFGGGRYFVELQYHPSLGDIQRPVNRGLIGLAREMDLPLVVTNDVHFISPDDYAALQVLRAIATGRLLTEAPPFLTPDHRLKSADEMWRIWGPHLPEALTNTLRVAEMVSFAPAPGPAFLPVFTPPSPHTAGSFLAERCRAGLEQYAREGRLTVPWERYTARLEQELQIIGQMGYEGYFLVVWDVVQHARRQGIPVGPGRGSAGGSLTAWTLGVTEIDPLAHGLLFERFLNPERVSLPDIDIDFCREGRAEILRYVAERYGRQQVAQIATLGTFGARQALRDVARVSGLSVEETDQLTALLPPPERGRAVSLDEAVENVPVLRRKLAGDARLRGIFGLARRIEGLVRHMSVHASGVVLSPCDIVEVAPLMPLRDGRGTAVQYPLESIEAAGLVKMDFLGLKALTVLEDARRRVKAECNVEIDLTRLPDADPATLDFFLRGDLQGVFQFEGEGISSLSRQLAPRSRGDIAVLSALYRPGPLDSGLVGDYLARRQGETATVMFPELESILAPTHGVPVYQEQIMAIFQTLAGYSPGEADLIRRAMGKKQREVLERQREHFLERAGSRGHDREALATLWRQLEGFADYAFNKCLDEGQILLTSHGPLTVAALSRYRVTDLPELWSWNGTDCVWQPMVDIFSTGQQMVWEVELDSGTRLRVTPEHRFLVTLGDGRETCLPLAEIAARGLSLCGVMADGLDTGGGGEAGAGMDMDLGMDLTQERLLVLTVADPSGS